jgi:hypothetical protein
VKLLYFGNETGFYQWRKNKKQQQVQVFLIYSKEQLNKLRVKLYGREHLLTSLCAAYKFFR